MTPHQVRIVIESVELSIKIDKLETFIQLGDVYHTLPVDEQNRLRLQLVYMKLYSDILKERIKAFLETES